MENKDKEDRNAYRAEQVGGDGMQVTRRKLFGQNEVAAWALRELNVSTPYVLDFEEHDSLYLFDCDRDCNNISRIAPSSELMDKVREIEKARNVKIYAVTHDYMPYVGEMYSFLCISPYQADWDSMVKLTPIKHHARVYAYVYNVDSPECSESGFVVLRINGGNLVRVG